MKLIETRKYLKKLELAEFPEPEIIRLNHPVLLCHGYGAIASVVNPSPLYEVCLILRKHGVLAFAPNIVPYATIEIRAEQWAERIHTLVETYSFEKLHIIAHSMGGLDLRYALNHADIAPYTASLTSVATPHRGTILAEFVLNTPGLVKEKLGEFANWFGNNLFPKSKSDSVGAIHQLTREYVREQFNPANPDVAGIPYYSYSAASGKGTGQPVNTIYRYQNNLIFEEEGPNDSFVSVESAKWGEHLGTAPISHIEQMHINVSKERKKLVENFWVNLCKDISNKELSSSI
ncbi:MAG: hypothetical protein WD355_07130 [Balneolaceae bacterium]